MNELSKMEKIKRFFLKKPTKKQFIAIFLVVCILATVGYSYVQKSNKTYASSYSASVKNYQIWLNKYYKTGLSTDGYYGCKTAQASVKVLQTLLNKCYGTKLAVDGYAGPKTIAALDKYSLKRGAKNDLVKFFQVSYNYVYSKKNVLDTDGIYGAKTEQAVKGMYNDWTEAILDSPSKGVTFSVWHVIFDCCGMFYECKLSGM